MDVSVIIVNYKTSELIADCVKSIIKETQGISYEVIIADNNSEPDFKEKISQAINDDKKEIFKFLPLQENIGFGRANNEGLKIASGRNIFFLNPDTVLLNNAIKILSDFLDHHKEAGACGGNLYSEDLNPAYSFKRLLPGLLETIDELANNFFQKWIYKENRIHNFIGKPLKVGFITGADLMVKKDVLEKTDVFSPAFFMYYEETDLCWRIKHAGWKIFSVPQAKIQHLESKSFTSTEAFESEHKTKMLETSRKLYFRRNHNIFSQKVCNLIYEAFLLSRILFINNPQKKEYYKRRRKFFKETW